MPAIRRFLTLEEKQQRLEQWHRERRLPRPAGPLGGRGFPDPDIFPLCDALNALPGICTIQSCAGHPRLRYADGATHCAHLWVRLDEQTAKAFDARVFELADDRDHFEEVVRLYSRGEGEVFSIEFRGNESGLLEESSTIILHFFQSLYENDGVADARGADMWDVCVTPDCPNRVTRRGMCESCNEKEDEEDEAIARSQVDYLRGLGFDAELSEDSDRILIYEKD